MSSKRGFSLAEALVALTLIGLVCVMVIPATVAYVKNKQYSLGIKRAIYEVNDAISRNMSQGKRSAYYTDNLRDYLANAMNAISVAETGSIKYFYTKGGMRYDFPTSNIQGVELSSHIQKCGTLNTGVITDNPDAMISNPCVVIVDINGNKKPNRITNTTNGLQDRFVIIVTDKNAYPYDEFTQRVVADN